LLRVDTANPGLKHSCEWILEQAGIVFDAAVEPGKLSVVAG